MKVLDIINEGDVVQFPKKHKGDVSDMHSCPKCGGDVHGGKYIGHQVKVCVPCKQVYLPPNSGIDKHGNKVDEIAGAFPSPSTREKWAKDAAASNAAEAKRQALLKAQADAERLKNNTAEVDRLQKINHHSLDSEIPSKEVKERAVSKAQQRFMGMVHAAQKGGKAASPEVAKVAKGMSKKAGHDFAATKHKGLPAKKTTESATPGATSAANIGTVDAPQLSPGKARGKKSYIGDPWGGKSGTKAPPQPKVKQPKNSDGTAKNGLDMKGNIFGGGAVKR